MKISIIHPTRGRFQQASKTLTNWMYYANTRIEYIVSMDENDTTLKPEPDRRLRYPWDSQVIYIKNKNKNAIDAINIASKRATGDLLIVISDDFACFDNWDTLLLKALEGKTDFCVKTDDGLQPTLITMPIMDRIYYERYGYVYHPDYLHMFADQELTAVAMMTGKYIKLDLSFPHLHYTTGKTAKDEVNVRNDRTWGQGQRLFDKHLETNFGIESPVMPYSEIKWK